MLNNPYSFTYLMATSDASLSFSGVRDTFSTSKLIKFEVKTNYLIIINLLIENIQFMFMLPNSFKNQKFIYSELGQCCYFIH